MSVVRTHTQRTRAAYGAWSRAILELLATNTALTVAAFIGGSHGLRLAPRILARANRRVIHNTLRRLAQRDCIAMVERNGEVVVTITERGKQRILRGSIDSLRLQRPKRWDRRWRLVIFDIPESHRVARRLFQRKLRSVGFAPVQRSVYVTPFPCADALDLLYEVYEVRPFVHCIEIPSLGRHLDARFRSHFKLR